MTTAPRTFGAAVAVFFRHFSPVVLVLSALVALGYRATLGAFGLWDVAIVVALWAVWPVQEWLIHVFILHFKPFELFGLRVDPLNARKHRAHHRDPNRVDLVFIPWFSVVSSLPLLVLIGLFAFPSPALGGTFLAAYLVQAAHYEWSHYLAHVPYTPAIPYYQRICKAHMLHHFRNEHFWYGVSRTLGDTLLRTEPDPSATPKSETVRTLGIEMPSA